jgi:hypothetical protein
VTCWLVLAGTVSVRLARPPLRLAVPIISLPTANSTVPVGVPAPGATGLTVDVSVSPESERTVRVVAAFTVIVSEMGLAGAKFWLPLCAASTTHDPACASASVLPVSVQALFVVRAWSMSSPTVSPDVLDAAGDTPDWPTTAVVALGAAKVSACTSS